MRFGDIFGRCAAIALAAASFGAAANDAGEVPEQLQKLLVSVQTLSSPAPAPEDFGFSVALSDRYAVIGAPDESISGVKSGAVYIFARFPTDEGSAYRLIERIVAPPFGPPPGTQSVDRFGQSIAVFGETIVIGAPGVGGTGSAPGRVRFYVRDPRALAPPFFIEKAVLDPGQAAEILNGPSAAFGHTVALDGPFLFVGAPRAAVAGMTGPVGSGAVVVYKCPFTPSADGLRFSCAKQRVIVPPDLANGAEFGFSLGVQRLPRLPDLTLVVGSPAASDCPLPPPMGGCSPVATGAMYSFIGLDATWNFIRKYTPAAGAANDRYGHSVAHAGPAVAVGAPNDNGGVGTVRILEGADPGQLAENATLRATGTEQMHFGARIALFNGRIAIAAPDRTVGTNPRQGSTFLFERIVAGRWEQRDEVTRPFAAPGTNFGVGLAVSGDTMIVGEPDGPADPDGGGPFNPPGRAYVYFLGRAVDRVANPNGAEAPQDRFGSAVARNGDVMVVGLPGKESGPTLGAGVVQVFLRDASGGFPVMPTQTIVPPAGEVIPGLGFGAAVSLSTNGALLVVGAPGATVNGAADAGAAFVYPRTATTYSTAFPPAIALVRPGGTPSANELFGSAVDIGPDGGIVVVGAPGANGSVGGVYVFDDVTAPAAKAKGMREYAGKSVAIAAGTGAIGDKWGSSVATDGTTVVAGAVQDVPGGGDGYVNVMSDDGSGYAVTDTMLAPADDASSPSDEQGFGAAVDIDAGTVVVGAPTTDVPNGNANTTNTDEGTAYAFVVDAGQASNATVIAAPSGELGDKWGTSVAVSEGTVASGGPGTDVSNPDGTASIDQGAVITFECATDAIGESDCDFDQTMFGKGAEEGEGIGSAIAFDGEEFVVGAPDADSGGFDAGAIYTGADLFSSAAVAVNDTGVSVAEDSSANVIDVLANDTGDLESGEKTVIGVGIAANGATSVGPLGTSVRYTPNLNYCGSDSFTYSLDGGSVGAVTLAVTCVNDAPVAVGTLANRTAVEDDLVSFATAAGFSDIDDASLTYSATGLPAGLSVAPATGLVGGTIAAGASAQSPYTVTIIARDAANAQATQGFQYTVSAPVPGGDLIFGSGFE